MIIAFRDTTDNVLSRREKLIGRARRVRTSRPTVCIHCGFFLNYSTTARPSVQSSAKNKQINKCVRYELRLALSCKHTLNDFSINAHNTGALNHALRATVLRRVSSVTYEEARPQRPLRSRVSYTILHESPPSDDAIIVAVRIIRIKSWRL